MKIRLHLFFILFCATLCTGPGHADTPDALIFHTSPESQALGYPFSDAVEVDGWLYISGQIGADPEIDILAKGGIEGQTRQTMDNIKSHMERLGLNMGRIVKCTVMLEEMADWSAFNVTPFTEPILPPYPARSALGADGLALGAAVEVECIARR